MKKFGFTLFVLSWLLASGGCNTGDRSAQSEGETLRIAMIPKGTSHIFWNSIHAGGIKAQRELEESGTPVELIWKGPLGEGDRSAQISVVENFTSQQVDAICLAPLDEVALVAPVERAVRAGVPVIVFDSGLKSDKTTSFIATNNLAGGELGGQYMAELLGGTGKVILLRYQEGSASTTKREAGFLEAIDQHPGIDVISDNVYAGNSRATAQEAAENLLNRFGDEVDGIFCPNESSTVGVVLALKGIGKAQGEIKLVGFDGGDHVMQALRDGDVQGLVLQDPVNMGYLSLMKAVEHVKGGNVETLIDTGSTLITLENVDDPELQTLVDPPLEEYLN